VILDAPMNLPIISREFGDLNLHGTLGPEAQRAGSALRGAALTRNELLGAARPGSIVVSPANATV
jgi:hypothetical protein